LFRFLEFEFDSNMSRFSFLEFEFKWIPIHGTAESVRGSTCRVPQVDILSVGYDTFHLSDDAVLPPPTATVTSSCLAAVRRSRLDLAARRHPAIIEIGKDAREGRNFCIGHFPFFFKSNHPARHLFT
jgi:hypothetical protein